METPACQRAGAPTPRWRLRFLLHSCLVGGGGAPPRPPPRPPSVRFAVGWPPPSFWGPGAAREEDRLICLGSVGRLVDQLVLGDPGHHRAQSGAYHFDAVLGGVAAA